MNTTIVIPTLTTERLTLRAPRMEDFGAFAAFRASDRTQYVGGRRDERESFVDLAAIVGHWHLRGFGRWLVADRATDAPLGVVGIMHTVDWPEPEIAWSVFAGAEGRGIAYEAAVASRRYAYEALGFTTLISMVEPGNERSSALARRLGATYEGNYRHAKFGDLEMWRHLSPAEVKAAEGR